MVYRSVVCPSSSSRDDQTTATPTSMTYLLSTCFPLVFQILISQINLPQWPCKRLFNLCIFFSITSDLYTYLGSTSVKFLHGDRTSTRVRLSGYQARPLIKTSPVTTERRFPDFCKFYSNFETRSSNYCQVRGSTIVPPTIRKSASTRRH